jgi:hypothetical protein
VDLLKRRAETRSHRLNICLFLFTLEKSEDTNTKFGEGL